MLDPNRGTNLVLEHHSIHVTYTQHRFPQAYDIKQHPLQCFCIHSTYQYVQSTYSVHTCVYEYILGTYNAIVQDRLEPTFHGTYHLVQPVTIQGNT